MRTIPLYKHKRADGGITVSPIKPDCEYTKMYRLIADEGKTLTNGEVVTSCIDIKSTYGWTEIDKPIENIMLTNGLEQTL